MDIQVIDDTNARKRRICAEEDFELQLWGPAMLLARFLHYKEKREDIKQINFFCRKNADDFDFSDPIIDGYWDIIVPYDPNTLLGITNNKEKTQEVESLFRKILIKTWEYKGWDSAEVETALWRAKQVGFTFTFLLKGTPKKAPDKKHTAIVKCTVDFMSFLMTCSIHDRFGVLVREEVMAKELPSPFIYSRLVGKPVWETNEVFSVVPKLGGRHIGRIQLAEVNSETDDRVRD